MSYLVRDLMSKGLIIANPNDSIAHAQKLMQDKRIHSILIPGKTWMIITHTDLLLVLESGDDPQNLLIGDYASPIKVLADPDWDVKTALDKMVRFGVKELPVFDGTQILGIITSTEIYRLLAGDSTTDAPAPDVKKKGKGK